MSHNPPNATTTTTGAGGNHPPSSPSPSPKLSPMHSPASSSLFGGGAGGGGAHRKGAQSEDLSSSVEPLLLSALKEMKAASNAASASASSAPPSPPPLMSQPVLLSGGERPSSLGSGGGSGDSRSRTMSGGGGGGGGGLLRPPPKPHTLLLPPRPPSIQPQSRQATLNSAQGTTLSKISIRDIVEHSPLESEADTYIQSTLDEVDPTRGVGFTGLPQTTILGHVPQDAARDAFEEIKSPGTAASNSSVTGAGGGGGGGGGGGSATANTAPSLPLFRTHHSRENKTSTAEDLWQLTMDMQKLDRPSLLRGATATAHHQASRRKLSLDEDGGNPSNSLVENAVRILKRNASVAHHPMEGSFADPRDDNNSSNNNNNNNASAAGSAAEAGGELSAADRWMKLKNALQVTSGLDAKKSDETTPDDDVEEGKDGKGKDGGGGKDDGGGDDELVEISTQDDDNNEREDGRGPRDSERFHSTVNAASLRKKRGKATYKDFEDWVKFKSMSFKTYAKLVLSVMFVAAGVAAVLFYAVGNPPCNNGRCTVVTNSTGNDFTFQYFSRASASWWLLFLCCRQVVTMSLARITENLIIDYFALRSKLCVRFLGPFVTLFIVQSKGWPFMLFFWGIYDFALLFGSGRFAAHWLFYQDAVGMFNEQNPSGGVTSSQEYQTVLILAVVVSFVVAVKRFWLGLVQGKRTYRRYGEELAKVMKKALWVGQVASLARDIEDSDLRIEDFTLHVSNEFLEEADGDTGEPSSPKNSADRQEEFRRNLVSGVDSSTRQAVLDELLGAWEEPETQREKDDHVNIASIIQFRQSLTYLNEAFPFGVAFGPASTRHECVESAELVYNRLMRCIPSRLCLTFDVLALLAVRKEGDLNEEKLKNLIKLFRPDREGNLTLLDFAKSVDTVYKELRLLRASVANASKLEKAFQSIFNIFFYIVLVCIILASIGIDPLVLFASISGFVLGFAFMIGAACSKYFEGLLLIFVRRPYDIGDRIALSNPFTDTISTGSQSWVVKDIDLYTTTVVLGATNEVSTISNGSLAGLRIINCARSPKGTLSFLLKFPIDVSYTKLLVFKSAIEKFIKARPREWISFLAFRATRVEADLGFVEHVVVAQHRESWQNLGALLESKAQLSSFALELSKKMDMRYVSPPMPIDLNLQQRDARLLNIPIPDVIERETEATPAQDYDVADSVAAMFGTKLSPTKLD